MPELYFFKELASGSLNRFNRVQTASRVGFAFNFIKPKLKIEPDLVGWVEYWRDLSSCPLADWPKLGMKTSGTIPWVQHSAMPNDKVQGGPAWDPASARSEGQL